jgi:hypothetical protein
VRHTNTVFHDLLKLVPWGKFDRLVIEHGSDTLVRKLTTRQQFIALLFGQLAGANSLRDIVTSLESHRARLYHVGGRVLPARSTLADANRQRSHAVFSNLFEHMLGQASRALRKEMRNVVRLIDSTGLRLSGIGCEWSRFSAKVCGAKAHIIYDPDLGRPIYHAVTPAKTNDITVAQQMPIEPGATYVFDLGYYDYAWWAKLDDKGCRIVTRFKANTPLQQAQEQPLDPDANVLYDRIGFLPARQANSRRNRMQDPVREIGILTETGKHLRILSNDLDAAAQEIADLYKRRWQIELFFRLIKQILKIRHYFGRSENAVRIQIAVALVAFLILHLLQKSTQEKHSMLELTRLVRTNIMHRKDVKKLKQIQTPPPKYSGQLAFTLATT